MTWDISGDWEVVSGDGTHTVTLFRKTAEGRFDSGTSVASVLRQDVTKEEMESRYLLAKAGVVWHLWAAKTGGIVPKIGDVIQDSDSARWTVKQVGIMSVGTRYECVTVRERD